MEKRDKILAGGIVFLSLWWIFNIVISAFAGATEGSKEAKVITVLRFYINNAYICLFDSYLQAQNWRCIRQIPDPGNAFRVHFHDMECHLFLDTCWVHFP